MLKEVNSVNFRSQIRVVSPNCFNIVAKKMVQDGNCENISEWEILPAFAGKITEKDLKQWLGYRKDVSKVYTKGIRSCTAGIVVNKGGKAPLAMHILDSDENWENLPKLKEYFNGTSAILIGSKDRYPLSRKIFSKIKQYSTNNMPTTRFRDLRNQWEANLAYIAEDDVLYLSVNKCYEKNIYVKNLEELNKAFREIIITSKDKIEFLSVCKENILKMFSLKQAEKIFKRIKA